MKDHNQQLEFLERNMDNEKSRQMASIADKIAEKKRKRALALAKRHDADKKKELAEERKERNELMDQQVWFFNFLITAFCFPTFSEDIWARKTWKI